MVVRVCRLGGKPESAEEVQAGRLLAEEGRGLGVRRSQEALHAEALLRSDWGRFGQHGRKIRVVPLVHGGQERRVRVEAEHRWVVRGERAPVTWEAIG